MNHFESKAIHFGAIRPSPAGAINTPIFQSATYEQLDQTAYEDLKYIRLNNTPNHEVLHRRLACLEGAEDALVTSSGMAAIYATLSTLLKPGDHLLVQNCLYGGTHHLVHETLTDLGIEVSELDANPLHWKSQIRKKTKLIYVETITNPLMQVIDHNQTIAFAKENGLVSVVDNTFASPYNFAAVTFGYDLAVHSATKYLNGHSDIVAGVVAGSKNAIFSIRKTLNIHGGSLDPHACFLLERGLKTLALRVDCQNQNALEIAKFLKDHPAIQQVYYPGLEDEPGFAIYHKFMKGFGGMLSFRLSPKISPKKFFERLEIPFYAPSLGGVESLITQPSASSHAGLTEMEQKKLSIDPHLIRLSVGIEHVKDLIADLKQALEACHVR